MEKEQFEKEKDFNFPYEKPYVNNLYKKGHSKRLYE
jgi:hypothetical protein